MGGEECHQLLHRVDLGRDLVADVRPVETGDHHAVLGDAELVEDVGAGLDVRGGGQRDPRHAALAHQVAPSVAPPLIRIRFKF